MLFRSAHKLLMDSATSEYLFCHDFWAGDASIFREVFAPAVAAVEENLTQFLGNCFDIGCIILMVRAHAPGGWHHQAFVTSTHVCRSASTTNIRSSCRADARPAWTRTSTR